MSEAPGALLAVEAPIWEHFPALSIVLVVAEGIAAAPRQAALRAEAEERVAALATSWSFANPQSHPRIAAWRQAMRAVGVSGKRTPSSIEALVRRLLGGGELPRVGPLVDLYNSVSVRHLVPAGGWDLDTIGPLPLRLALTTGGEPFRELGGAEALAVAAGEVSYLAADEVVTRHFVWRQSERGKLTERTRRALFVSEVLGPLGLEVACEVEADLAGALGQVAADVRSAILVGPPPDVRGTD